MIECRFNDNKTDLDLSVTQVVKDMTEIRVYDERSAIRERIQNWRNIYEPPSSLKAEFEEFKKNHLDEIENIKQQLVNEKETYEKEKEEWIAQRTEIEQELNSIKIQQENKLTELQSISYDVEFTLFL